MNNDPYPDEHNTHTPSASAPAPVVTCPACGVGLQNVRIGEPCPACGEVIGSGRSYAASLPPSGKATAALVLGIISIPVCFFYGIPAIICGILALVFAKQAKAQIAGGQASPMSSPNANAGRICGMIGLSLGIIYLVLIAAYIVFIVWIIGQSGNSNSPFFSPPAQPTPAQPTLVPNAPPPGQLGPDPDETQP